MIFDKKLDVLWKEVDYKEYNKIRILSGVCLDG